MHEGRESMGMESSNSLHCPLQSIVGAYVDTDFKQ
jgi:hypothetical protein